MSAIIMYQRQITRNRDIRLVNTFLIVLISLAAFFHLHLIFLQNINWDEFLYLSKVYKYNSGTLDSVFQSYYVHFFRWLPSIPGAEIKQIFAARIIIYTLMIGTSVYIFLIGKKLFCTTASLFAVFCYLATSNTLEHGSSFRADPICAFLFLITIKILFNKRASWISTVIAGIITALSLMISIKVIFYLGTICLALLLLFRLQEEKKSGLTRIVVFGISFAVFFAILYTTHRWGLLLPDDHNTIKILSRVSSKVILADQINPNLSYFLLTLQENISIWSILLAGILVSLFDVMKGWREQRNNILLLSLLPLLFPLVFYRNTFPYFFVFIMAPLVLYCGAFLEKVVMGYTREGRRVYLIILNISIFAVALHLFLNYSTHNYDRTAAQKQLIYVIHKIFPNPVPYIDRCSMVSSFPKVGFFMSTI